MPQFLKLQPPFEALEKFLQAIPDSKKQVETIPTTSALFRTLAEDLYAPHPLPEFPRSTVDGYAVRAANTFGASEGIPAMLKVIGEVPMGDRPTFEVLDGQAAIIHTGGMIPTGADAVVMLEQTQLVSNHEVEIYKAVGQKENVIKAGQDVKTGDLVIPAGKVLRIPEIGGLMSFGYTHIGVTRKPRVGILSSGDEVILPHETPRPGQVRDINTTTMSLIVSEAGGEPVQYGIISDREDELRTAAEKAFAENDAILITAGSSASSRDLTSVVVNSLGKPGVLVHGVSVRPGKPTILAVCDGKPIIGLPGNPVSALAIANIFVRPVVKKLLHQLDAQFRAVIRATLSATIPSVAGREDWVPVQLIQVPGGYKAEPIYFVSNLIFNLVKADAMVHIPADVTGLQAGELIDVELI